jgi:hypothetical protein
MGSFAAQSLSSQPDSQLSHVELTVDSQQFLATGLMARFLFVTMEIRAWSKELDGRAAGTRGQRGLRPAFLQEGIAMPFAGVCFLPEPEAKP